MYEKISCSYDILARLFNNIVCVSEKKFPYFIFEPISGDDISLCDFCVHEFSCHDCVFGDCK